MAIPAVPPVPCRKCGKTLKSGGTARNPHFPFCSIRCRHQDLGAWMDETYRVPVDPSAELGAELADGLGADAPLADPDTGR